jgi:hypothetical protein
VLDTCLLIFVCMVMYYVRFGFILFLSLEGFSFNQIMRAKTRLDNCLSNGFFGTFL